MPLTPEQHRRPKKEDLPPWPKEFDKQYPLDTIKTNISTDLKYTKMANHHGKSRLFNSPTAQCCMDMMHRGGIREFYRGAIPPFFAVGVYRMLNMAAYRETKWVGDIIVHNLTGVSPLAVVNTVGSKPTFHTAMCFTIAGGLAGGASSLYTSPMELIKYAQQLSQKIATEKAGHDVNPIEQKLRESYANKNGIVQISKVIRNNFGWRGFFFGFKYHLIRDVLGGASYFGSYEYVKHSLGPQQGREASHGGSVFVAGVVCGGLSSAILMPFDTAKSRYQKECLYSATRPKFPKFSYIRDFRSNFPGFWISVARSGLTHGIFFLTYESIKRHIEIESEQFTAGKKL